MGDHLRQSRFLLAVTGLALLDWMLALTMTVADVRRPVAIPVLAVAVVTVWMTQLPRLHRIAFPVIAAGRRGASRWEAAEVALGHEWSPRVAALVLREPRLLWSVVLLLRGRRDGADRGDIFPAHRQAFPTWIVLGGLAVLELFVSALLPLPLIVHSVLLVLGVWGGVVILGLAAALVVHPHLVTDDEVVLRFGFWSKVSVPRTAIADVRRVASASAPRGLHVVDRGASLTASGNVNVAITLKEPVMTAGQSVTRVHTEVDSPEPFAAACRRESTDPS